VRVFDPEALARHRVSRAELVQVAAREEAELARRLRNFKQGRPCENVVDRTVVLVDDGATTGATLRAAILALHERRPARIVVAVPTSPAGVVELLRNSVDMVHCLMTPAPFESIERWYEFFSPTTDGEVRELLAMARESEARDARPAEPGDARPPDPRRPALWSL
jgi:putative phosphoribosyl transferase